MVEEHMEIYTPAPDHRAEIERLAKLDPMEYDKERERVAAALGCRVATLDKETAKTRADNSVSDRGVDLCSDTEPCSEPVEVSMILDAVRATILRFIVCDKDTATTAALWVAFTWIIDHVQVAPLAIITAPEKGCGKTQLLDVIGRLSKRSLLASNISPAATFRAIEAMTPTLLIDEADAFMRDNEELRGIINSGHTRPTAYVIRTVGDNHEVKKFSTWGAKAIAGIGRLPETVMSRGLVLTLRRKLKGESVERLRHSDPALFEMLRGKLSRFGADYGPLIGRARPKMPDALGDRPQDNWEPLFAIADVAGGLWPKETRQAALTLSGAERDAISASEELLEDIRDIFDANKSERISMAELLQRLLEDETAPWATWSRGRPMTVRQLGSKLKEFNITAQTVHITSHDKPKGFHRKQFEDAWSRYLRTGADAISDMSLPDTPLRPDTQSLHSNINGIGVTEAVTDEKGDRQLGHFDTVLHGGEVTNASRPKIQSPIKSPENPSNFQQGDWVTDHHPTRGVEEVRGWEMEI
jgi:hypothetical protein